MNTNFKNAIVALGFAGCALILMAIVSLGTSKVNEANNKDADLLAKAKIEKVTTSPLQQEYLK